MKQSLQRFAGAGLLHQGLTDEEGLVAGIAQALHVFGRVDATLCDVDRGARQVSREFAGAVEQIYEGTAQVQRLVIARQLIGK